VKLEELLGGGDPRTLGDAGEVVRLVLGERGPGRRERAWRS
jgi:hypothetical protein